MTESNKDYSASSKDIAFDWPEFWDDDDEQVLQNLTSELREIVPLIRQSAANEELTTHSQQVEQACRISRRIRLRIGNPYDIGEEVRHSIVELFEECVKSIAVDLPYDTEEAKYISNCRDHICSRAVFLRDPEKLEKEMTPS